MDFKVPDRLTCPACGSVEAMACAFPIRSATTDGKGALMFDCADCGTGRTVYTEDLSGCYEEDYYSYSPEGYSSRRKFLKGLMYKYLKFLPRSISHRWLTVVPPGRTGKVLDVGCGCGNSLDVWKRIGWQTFGTEISEAPAKICVANGHDVRLSFKPAEAFAGSTFEWITLDNVLEHVEDPGELLAELKTAMTEDSVMTICVPNYGGTPSRVFGRYWDAILPEQHLTHFTRKGLEALIGRCGLRVKATSFQPRFHLPTDNVARFGQPAELETAQALAQKWKKSAVARLVTGGRMTEADGYFMTIEATL
ncbi:class I SAM-dependent methyltransferase [Sphingomonas sp.]|uniref:class I SAM-dependent methyltransferase n=1 Tax=Sphingomonas sp. TaxID=28214 RepID=UPI002ED86BAE